MKPIFNSLMVLLLTYFISAFSCVYGASTDSTNITPATVTPVRNTYILSVKMLSMIHVQDSNNRSGSGQLPGYETNVSDGRLCRSSYIPRATIMPDTPWTDYCFAIAMIKITENPAVVVGALGGYDIYVNDTYALCREDIATTPKSAKKINVIVTILCEPTT
jgi:hypothetical protein